MRPNPPRHLKFFDQTEAQGIVSTDQQVAQFEVGSLKNFVYALLNPFNRTAILVDAPQGVTQVLDALEAFRFNLKAILLTHSHFDHINGLPEINSLLERSSSSSVPLYVHPLETHRLKALAKIRVQEVAPETFCPSEITSPFSIRAHHTPGHTAGALTFELILKEETFLFTGDTLFIRDCGRTDLETGNNDHMFSSLQKIKKMNPQSIILPGHHYAPEVASTLEQELRTSACLQVKSVQELANLD